MSRFTAGIRFEVLSQALAMAEDRDGAPLADIAAEIGRSHDDLWSVLAPIFYLEPVDRGEPLGFELARAVWLEPDLAGDQSPSPETRLVVETNWWRDLAQPSLAESVTLYVLATTVLARGDGSDELATAAHKLAGRLRADVEVHESDETSMVTTLESFCERREAALCRIEGRTGTLATMGEVLDIHAVFRSGDSWVALCGRKPKGDLLALDRDRTEDWQDRRLTPVPVERFLSAAPTGQRFDLIDMGELPAGVVLTEKPLVVTLDIDTDAQSVLDDFQIERADPKPNGRMRVKFEVWGETELKTVLLRLGDRGQLIEPPELADLGQRVARETLSLYDA
jgi:hypothetical protein